MKVFSKLNIHNKVLVLVLGISIFSLLLFFVFSRYSLKSEGKKSLSSIDILGKEAAKESEENLKAQAKKYLRRLIEAQASSSNYTFKIIETQVNIANDYSAELWNNPERYGTMKSEKLQGELLNPDLKFYYGIAENVSETKLTKEVKLLSNLQSVFRSIVKNNMERNMLPVIIDGIYLGSESGIFYNMSPNPAIEKGYDPRTRPWYIQAKKKKSAGWTDLYEDAATKEYAISYFTPCYDSKNNLKGVMLMYLTINSMLDVLRTQISDIGEIMLVDKDGKILTYSLLSESAKNFIGSETTIKESKNRELREIAQSLAAKETGIKEVNYGNDKKLVGYSPVNTTGWQIVVIAKTDEIMEYVNKTNEKITESKNIMSNFSEKSMADTIKIMVLFFITIIIVTVLVSYKFSILITNPLDKLLASVKEVGNGNLDINLNIKTGDEVEQLADAFQKMTIDLKTFIKNLQDTTAAKQKIESELHVATAIQASMLPRIFPPFPDRKEIELFASMEPAKEVGGDLYDFFLVDSNKLCFVIGDVSGKGVPASLFMVITKTLIKNEAQRGISVEEVFNNVNKMLSEQNDECMFVTSFIGILNLDTGEVEFANAGHNPPLIGNKESGKFEYLTLPKGFVLAGMAGMKYKKGTIQMEEGDILFMYTDGVTEAMNINDKLYSDKRLEDKLSEISSDRDVRNIIKTVREDIKLHVGEAEQSDDITMLVIKYNGKI